MKHTSKAASRPSLRTWTAFGLLAGVVAVGAEAGFDWPKGVPDARKKYDGEPLARAGRYPSDTVAKLKAKFGGTNDQARAKLDTMRANVKKAIELVEAEDAAIGKCLEDACNCERLCLDFKSVGAKASVLPDGTTDCTKDTVNIGINKVSCTEESCYSPAMFRMFTSLLHEGKHMMQSYSADAGAGGDLAAVAPCTAKVKKARKSSCNEIEAENLENSVINKLKAPLNQIINGQPVTNPPGGAAGLMLAGVQSDPNPVQAAKDLLAEICATKTGNDQHLKCQQARKAAFDAFLASPGTAADKKKMNDEIRKTSWFTLFPGSDNFGPVAMVTTGGGRTDKVAQTDGTQGKEFPTQLNRATDLVFVSDIDAIVAGVDDSGTGFLLHYQDWNGDGFLDPASRKVLAQSSLVSEGIELTYFPPKNLLYAFSASNDEVYEVADMDGDGVPETISPFPATVSHPDIENIHSFEISDDGNRLYGTYFGDDNALPIGSEMLVFEDSNSDGYFESATVTGVFEEAAFVTAFASGLQAGQSTLELHAPYLANVEVFRVALDGTPLTFLGATTANSIGTANVSLTQPLVEGDLIATWDLTNGIQGPAMEVFVDGGATLTVDKSNVSASSGGTQTLSFDGGAALGGHTYLLIGSASGTSPGFLYQGSTIPLNWDSYTDTTISQANQAPFINTSGTLSASGSTACAIQLGTLPPALVGTTFHHALVTFNGSSLSSVSNATSMTIAP